SGGPPGGARRQGSGADRDLASGAGGRQPGDRVRGHRAQPVWPQRTGRGGGVGERGDPDRVAPWPLPGAGGGGERLRPGSGVGSVPVGGRHRPTPVALIANAGFRGDAPVGGRKPGRSRLTAEGQLRWQKPVRSRSRQSRPRRVAPSASSTTSRRASSPCISSTASLTGRSGVIVGTSVRAVSDAVELM